MSDVEGEWKPNGRPTSTLALNFAASLDSVFELSPVIESLSKSIARKRQSVSIQKSELEHIQARIRETEERLKESQGGSASSASITQQSQRIPGRRPPGLGSVPLVESDEEEDGSDSSESSDSESDDESAGVNKPLRNSQSTAQTSPSEASDSDTEDEDDNEEEDEEEEEEVGKQPTPRRQSTSRSSPIHVGKQQPPTKAGKRPIAKQGQRKTLPSRGKA